MIWVFSSLLALKHKKRRRERIAKAVEEMKIPFLRLESSYEYSREALGPVVTRIESFIESTKQRRSR